MVSSAVTREPLWSDAGHALLWPFWSLSMRGGGGIGFGDDYWGELRKRERPWGVPSTGARDQGLSLSLPSPTVSWRRLKDPQPLAPFSSASCLGSRETVWPFLQLNRASWPGGRGATQEGVGWGWEGAVRLASMETNSEYSNPQTCSL